MTPIAGVLETVLYAADLDAAQRFYGDMLGLPLDSSQPGLFRFFRAGPAMFLVFDAEAAARNRNVPPHGTIGPGHACFAVPEADLDGWKERIDRARHRDRARAVLAARRSLVLRPRPGRQQHRARDAAHLGPARHGGRGAA